MRSTKKNNSKYIHIYVYKNKILSYMLHTVYNM